MPSEEQRIKNDYKIENKENLPFQDEWSKGLFISSKAIPVFDLSGEKYSLPFDFSKNFRNFRTNHRKSDFLDFNLSESFESSLNLSKADQSFNFPSNIDKLARIHKTSANNSNPSVCWRGVLEDEKMDWETSRFSQKFFVGGLPSKIEEEMLKNAFRKFDNVNIIWPKNSRYQKIHEYSNAGYVYIVFSRESSIRSLLSACKQNKTNNNFFYSFVHFVNESEQMAEVQIIPWLQSDLFYQKDLNHERDFRKTIFVGALHGTMTARGLFKIMNELFGCVVSAEIDCDKYKYPIGSGKVIFSSKASYLKAIDACFVGIKSDRFSKKIQIDPYLEETYCERCGIEVGIYFCRNLKCLSYFCKDCWNFVHFSTDESHLPVTRNF